MAKKTDEEFKEWLKELNERHSWSIEWPNKIAYCRFLSPRSIGPDSNIIIIKWNNFQMYICCVFHTLFLNIIFPYHIQFRPYKEWEKIDQIEDWFVENKIKYYMFTRGDFYLKKLEDAIAFKLRWI